MLASLTLAAMAPARTPTRPATFTRPAVHGAGRRRYPPISSERFRGASAAAFWRARAIVSSAKSETSCTVARTMAMALAP